MMMIQDHERAEYIADMTNELARMARAGGLEQLAYLLEVASLEAEGFANPGSRPVLDGHCH